MEVVLVDCWNVPRDTGTKLAENPPASSVVLPIGMFMVADIPASPPDTPADRQMMPEQAAFEGTVDV